MKKIASLGACLILCLNVSGARGGEVRGPQSHVDMVRAHATDVYLLRFEGLESAQVRISGDGSTDLDCYAYDQFGNLADSDADSTDDCILRWTPIWTGKFEIKIKNLGNEPNVYSIRTN